MATQLLGELLIEREDTSARVPVEKETVTFGRAADNDVVLADARASRRHARLEYRNGRFFLIDANSSNGTWIGERRITEEELAPGASFTIGATTITLTVVDSATQLVPAPPSLSGATINMQFTNDLPVKDVKRLRLDRPIFTLGRDPSSDLVLPHPSVSRLHAQIRKVEGGYAIFDLKSTNGTFINGEQVEMQRRLQAGDEIRIGSFRIVFDGVAIAPTDEAGNVRLDVVHLKKTVGKGTVLLNDISLSIDPREFVAVVGVSGAGKSTFLDALNGFRPATEGAVLANGQNLYKNFDAYRTQIGYVPQEDIIHRELTVYEALDFAAQLRMPADTSGAERRQRIDDVLADLNLTAAKDRPINRLSGGQRKRVSIGVELLTKPTLFFLDEATSGLDPGTESQLMQLLARLADGGRTILLITHATKNVMLCDKVIFLAKGGHLAFFGPPAEALTYFGVQDFDQIYTKLEQELSPQEWDDRFRHSPQYQRYVAEPLKEHGAEKAAVAAAPTARPATAPATKRTSALTQLKVLSMRSLRILARDRASLVLMLIIAPVIGLIDLVTWKKNLFNVQGGDAGQAITMLFMMALICILVGSIASMREIVKEADIYRRERMVSLKIVPYVLSKVWLGVLLALYQAVIFIVSKNLGAGWPNTLDIAMQAYFTLVLATVAGMLLGLLISAVAPNQNVAPLLLIIVLVAQFMFAGGLLPINNFGAPGKALSQLTATKWAFESLVTISKLGVDVADDACWQLPKAERTALTDEQRAQCNCTGASVFKSCNFPGVQDAYVAAVDDPQPPEPARPADPPPQPQRPTNPANPAEAQAFQSAMDKWQTDMTAYQAQVKTYQDALGTWRTDFQNWKASRDRAIAEAEGAIDKVNEDFGEMFKVDLARHWSILGGLIGGVFLLILLVQKRKDVI